MTAEELRANAATLRNAVVNRLGKISIQHNNRAIRYSTPKEMMEAAKMFDDLADAMDSRMSNPYYTSNLSIRGY